MSLIDLNYFLKFSNYVKSESVKRKLILSNLSYSRSDNFISDNFFVDSENCGGDYWLLKSNFQNRFLGTNFKINDVNYIIDGRNSSVPVGETDKYNDVLDNWTIKNFVGTLRYALMGFSLNDFGYKCGGYTGSVQIDEVYRYNDILDSWLIRTIMGGNKSYGNSFSLQNGFVYDGLDGTALSNIIFKYDDVLDSWTSAAPVSGGGRQMEAALSMNSLFICDGADNSGGKYNTVEQFLMGLYTWLTRINSRTIKYGDNGIVLGDYGYTTGGWFSAELNTIDQFNEIIYNWIAKKNFITARYLHFGFDQGGLGYVVSGETSIISVECYRNFNYYIYQKSLKKSFKKPTKVIASVAIDKGNKDIPVWLSTNNIDWISVKNNKEIILNKLNPIALTMFYDYKIKIGIANFLIGDYWLVKTNINPARFGSASLGDLNNYAYSCGGGQAGIVVFDWNTKYNSEIDSWIAMVTLLLARIELKGLSLNGFGYVIGGWDGISVYYDDCERYDDGLDVWEIMASDLVMREGMSSFSLNGFGYVIGGVGSVLSADVDQYNDELDTWIVKTSIGSVGFRARSLGYILNDFGFVSLGYTAFGAGDNDQIRYDDVLDVWITLVSSWVTNARYNNSGFVVFDNAYVCCGYNGSTYYNDIDQYNAVLDVFTSKDASSILPVQEANGFTINGFGYNCAGENAGEHNYLNQYVPLNKGMKKISISLLVEE